MSDRLEQLLLEDALVSPEQINQAKWATQSTETTWLEQLLLLGALDEERLCDCVARASHLPRCNLDRLAAVPPAVLGTLPAEVAVEYQVVPLWVDSDGDLVLAMWNPIDTVALAEVQFFACRRLLRELAIPTAIAWALHQYYGAVTALWPRESRRPQALVVDSAPAAVHRRAS